MSMTVYEDARRENVWLRAFFMGPQGSGKSLGALELAFRIAALFEVADVVVVNTERGRGTLYAERFLERFGKRYQRIELEGDFSPEAYDRAISTAESKWPGAVLVLDSVTHEWAGAEGILQQADKFGDWKKIRPKHNAWVDRLGAYNGHLIATCRAKMKYDVAEEPRPGGNGMRQVISMLGVGPIQDGDLEYEFNLVGRFERKTHEVEFSGHVDPLDGVVTTLVGEPGDRVAESLIGWLSEGEPPAPPEAATDEAVAALVASLTLEGIDEAKVEATFSIARSQNRGVLHPDYVAEQSAKSQARLAAKAPPPADPKPADEGHDVAAAVATAVKEGAAA